MSHFKQFMDKIELTKLYHLAIQCFVINFKLGWKVLIGFGCISSNTYSVKHALKLYNLF